MLGELPALEIELEEDDFAIEDEGAVIAQLAARVGEPTPAFGAQKITTSMNFDKILASPDKGIASC